MKINVEPKDKYKAVICLEKNCRWERVCANHCTAGDFRSEDGSRPLLSLRNGEVHCQTINSPGHGYEYHDEPINVASPTMHHHEWNWSMFLWNDLTEETNDFQI